jgi:hypothetical protein
LGRQLRPTIAAPHIAIEIDRQASRLGLSVSLIDETLYDAFDSDKSDHLYTTSQYVIRSQTGFQEDLCRVYVRRRWSAGAVAFAHYLLVELLSFPIGTVPAVTPSSIWRPVEHWSGGQRIQALQRELRLPPDGSFMVPRPSRPMSLTPILVATSDPRRSLSPAPLESHIHPITFIGALRPVSALLA